MAAPTSASTRRFHQQQQQQQPAGDARNSRLRGSHAARTTDAVGKTLSANEDAFDRNAKIAGGAATAATATTRDGLPHRPRKRLRLDDSALSKEEEERREDTGRMRGPDGSGQRVARARSKDGGTLDRRTDGETDVVPPGGETRNGTTAAGAAARRSRHARDAVQPPPTGSLTANLATDKALKSGGLARAEGDNNTTGHERQQGPRDSKRVRLPSGGGGGYGTEKHVRLNGVDRHVSPPRLPPSPMAAGGSETALGATAIAAAAAGAPGPDKRTLRSQDGGSRSKSELSLYFPNYDEFISNEPKEAELLKADTRLFISEEPLKSASAGPRTFVQAPPHNVTPRKRRASQQQQPPDSPTLKKSPRAATAASLTDYTTLDLAAMQAKLPRAVTHGPDPFTADVYAAAHRRAERQEKQLRNIEKERAQHEKVQLERLYDGLRGHDWLRVMGISGVTESERKGWEGKRAYFVREVGALLEKFRLWKEEERRRKFEKEQQERDVEEAGGDEGDEGSAEADEDGAEDDDDDDDDDDNDGSGGGSNEGGDDDEDGDGAEIPDSDDATTDGQTASTPIPKASRKPKHLAPPRHKRSPNSADVDALAAQQLHTEALLSSTATKHPPLPSPLSPPGPHKTAVRRRKETGIPLPPAHEPAVPMTSFFAKPHQRVSALNQSRRSGRTQFAFGHPVPEVEEACFELPRDLVTDDARRANARSRRAARRKGRDE